jgi:hypothetical protein
MSETMIVRDVWLRFGGGPVQHFRSFDVQHFVQCQIDQGHNAKKPEDRYEVTVANEADYRAERWKR